VQNSKITQSKNLECSVLIVPGTTRVSHEIRNSLSLVKGITVYGAGTDVELGSSLSYEDYSFLGALSDTNVTPGLETLVDAWKINFIFFAHDDWIFYHRENINIGKAQIISHNSFAIKITSFKNLTYDLFSKTLRTPLLYSNSNSILEFPVFVKPNRGQGSIGSFKANCQNDLENYKSEDATFDGAWVVSEYIPGPEYTVDCFSDINSKVKFSQARIRSNIENGFAESTSLVELPEIEEWAKIISYDLKLSGPWFFQVKIDKKGDIKLLEIGLRVAGASGVERLKGINLSLMALYQSSGFEVNVINQLNLPTVSGADFDFNFYFEDVYVDFDDTLIIRDSLNEPLVSYLKILRNSAKKIFIITKNKGNIHELIRNFGIVNLADKVIQISETESKSEFISSENPFIFIDDSYLERVLMKKAFGNSVLVLDQSALEGRNL
jgi:carbamoyl-phosphate synthase large subunit